MTEQELLEAASKLEKLRADKKVLQSFFREKDGDNNATLYIGSNIFIRTSHTNAIYFDDASKEILDVVSKTLVQRKIDSIDKEIKELLP